MRVQSDRAEAQTIFDCLSLIDNRFASVAGQNTDTVLHLRKPIARSKTVVYDILLKWTTRVCL